MATEANVTHTNKTRPKMFVTSHPLDPKRRVHEGQTPDGWRAENHLFPTRFCSYLSESAGVACLPAGGAAARGLDAGPRGSASTCIDGGVMRRI